jgi:hypothetical protein
MYTSVGGGGAEGEEMSVFGEDDFGQPFLYTMNDTRAMKITVPIIPAGEENNQWFDWKGLLKKNILTLQNFASIESAGNFQLYFLNCLH